MAQRSDECWLGEIFIDLLDAGESVDSVAVHGAGAADSFSARAAEGEGGIQVVFDIDESIEVHGWYFLEIDVVADIFGLVVGYGRVILINQKPLHFGFLLLS